MAEAWDSLPKEFLARLDNVEIFVEDWPSMEDLDEVGLEPQERHMLLGLYHGVPQTRRDSWYAGVLPDRIVIYQRPIEALTGGDFEKVKAQVRQTVIHEVAHHYGIPDERLEELGRG